MTGAGGWDVETPSAELGSGVDVSSALIEAGGNGGGFTGGAPGLGVGDVADSDVGGVTAVVEALVSEDVSGSDDSPLALVAAPWELEVGSALHANANTATHDKHRFMPAL